MVQQSIHKVHHIKELAGNAFIIRFDRGSFDFQPGQYINISLANDTEIREYSIYSSIHDPFLEVLIKEVHGGYLSRKLKKLKKGNLLYIEGPFGYFLLPEKAQSVKNFFIATGTGISPFHCFTLSYPQLKYTLLHGVQTATYAYERECYMADQYILCTSKEKTGAFGGRVSDFLRLQNIDPSAYYFLCGNCDMIYEVHDILIDAQVSTEHIFAEVYF